jgi:nicotinamide mononucleotide (NMN) deamidase PncC
MQVVNASWVVASEMTGVAAEHTSAASANALSAIAAGSGVGTGREVGMVVITVVGTGVYVIAGVLTTVTTGGVVVLVQPLSAVIRTTTAILIMKTDEPFIFL